MSRVTGWDLIYGLLTVGEWLGPGCSLSRASNFKFSKIIEKTLQCLSQGPQAAAYIRGWGRRHWPIDFLPVTLLALITRTASVAADSPPLLAEPFSPLAEHEVRTLCGALRSLQGH